MKCPFCGEENTHVKDSRPSDEGTVIRRRRECPSCHRRFTTFERFQVQQIVVVKSDGRRELFEKEKLLRSVITAMRKRPVMRQDMESMVSDIEQMFIEEGRNELTSKEIGDAILRRIKELDFIGYIRYASVYHEFADPADFKELLKNV